VPIDEESRKFTAFVTHSGQYEFAHVPFGISNSPAVFCRYVKATLRDLIQAQTIVVYMDDLIVPSKNEYEGLKALEKVLSVASRAGLRIKWEKAQFLKSKINFLGKCTSLVSLLPCLPIATLSQ